MILIIGKNSKIFKHIRDKLNFEFIAIKSDEILSVDLTIFTCVYIFSYRLNENDNEVLIKYIANFKNLSVILISSIAVISTRTTLFYKYPKLKFKQEYSVLKYCSNFNIIRLGRFIFNDDPINSPDLISRPNDLIRAMKKSVNNFILYPVTNNKFELTIFNRFYIFINDFNAVRPVTRVFDLILKFAGCKFYGYTALTYTLYDETIPSEV